MSSRFMGWIFALLICFTVKGQFSVDTVASNEFLFGFPMNYDGATSLQLYIHAQESPATFNITTIDGNFEYAGTCSPLNPAVVDIPLSYEVRGNEFTWRNRGLKVFSNQKLSVLAWNYFANSYSAALVHPSCNEMKFNTSLHTYYIISTRGSSSQHSQFLIIGCQDDSNVTITPSQNVVMPLDAQSPNSIAKTIATGESHSVVLHSMQTLLVTSSLDLTNSNIKSDKPLSVISGARCASFPNGIDYCDFLMTQVPSTDQWGKRFLLSPHKGRSTQAYKMLATTEDTLIATTCNENAVTNYYILDTGESAVFFTYGDTYCSVVSTELIYMAQFGVGRSYNNDPFGDPTLSSIPPVEQHVNAVQFTALPTTEESYYSIVIQSDHLFNQSILLDGTLETISPWETIYDSNGTIVGHGHTSGAFADTHTAAHPDSNGVLSVMVHGWSSYGGYSYAAGSLEPINRPADDVDRPAADDIDGTSTISCTTECSPQHSELQYEVCCDPDNFGNFVTVVKSDTHIAYIACPAVAPDWCEL